MSSTYSPDLRIELIGTGDQAGVWGTTTNINLGTLLESAIAGYTSVSVTSANQALTANNGAADESRNAAIALTTTTTANFAVYAPPASKLYVIYNTTAYTATIYNSTVLGNTTAAGTGVAIPAGKTMTVWSDGTNMAQQNTHLISPSIATATLTSPAMSGTPTAPTASTGTNTTQVATTAFVQGEKVSPAFTGTPTAPTAAYGTNTTQLATTAFVQAALQALYPIGSIYSSTVSTNPGTLFGFGTWVAYAAGRVLIGDGGGFTAGSTGGSADAIVVAHTHTGTTGGQSNSHTHNFTIGRSFGGTKPASTGVDFGPYGFTNSNGYEDTLGTQSASADHTHAFTTGSTGSSGTGANLQPYVVVYMWNRTA